MQCHAMSRPHPRPCACGAVGVWVGGVPCPASSPRPPTHANATASRGCRCRAQGAAAGFCTVIGGAYVGVLYGNHRDPTIMMTRLGLSTLGFPSVWMSASRSVTSLHAAAYPPWGMPSAAPVLRCRELAGARNPGCALACVIYGHCPSSIFRYLVTPKHAAVDRDSPAIIKRRA